MLIEKDPRCFYKEMELRFCDCDNQKRARIETILRIMSDIAGVAYSAKGYTHSWLWEHHSVFLVTRAAIRMHRMPRADEIIIAKTWENERKGAQYYRDVQLLDQEGRTLVEGQTAWIVVDPETRAIQKPANFPGTFEPHPELVADTLPPDRLKISSGLTSVGSRKIVYSDIDSNNHTYNAVYAGIACDFLPAELMARPMTDFRINFKQEALLGETLDIQTWLGGNVATVVGKLGDIVSFECEMTFAGE